MTISGGTQMNGLQVHHGDDIMWGRYQKLPKLSDCQVGQEAPKITSKSGCPANLRIHVL